MGEKIQAARKKAGLTQKGLASIVGTASVTIRQYEANNREPSLAMLGKIAKALGTTVYEMIGPDWSGMDVSDAWVPIPEDAKNPAPTNGSGTKINPRYFELSEEARSVVDAMIDQLSKAGQSED
jgi:transcriptional regulator with XRE-family HTH domain